MVKEIHMKSPLISVIIPVYNSSKYILETLASIQNQTYKNWEIILVNDCSSDNSIELINEFSKSTSNPVKLITNQTNSGVSISRNIGVSSASGAWLALIDSDDVWLANHLETLINEAVKDVSLNVVFSGFLAFLDDVSSIIFQQDISKEMLDNFNISLYTHKIGITSSTALIEKTAWNSVGGMSKGLNHCEEMELFIRLAKADAKFKFSGLHTTLYRKHSNAGSASDNFAKMAFGTLFIYNKHFDWKEMPLKIRTELLANAHITYAKLIWRNDIMSAVKHCLSAYKVKAGLKNILPVKGERLVPKLLG